MVTLEQVRGEAAPDLYPRHILDGAETALVMFAAAFHGKQDAVFMADAGIQATCVDRDLAKLWEMSNIYPDSWRFEPADVFEYAASTNRKWDVVSLDPPTNLFDRCAGLAARWCELARRAVVLGSGPCPELDLPVGWRVSERLHRSTFQGGTYWTVIQPC